ncbi:hypothetical protein [Zunongwangia atlantica]|uniref:Uncharacterized protein n=1 Tax=Zunongwangia atlantica 22II14-10F7 TaxID=1185767 RepID=A0A1Y1SXU2_9FLAO|nr:hypothetical protein [Zunongwangia atlantica]ORL43570.1 hypothetical protein IIF7_20166 [Zunongwangia atlantica 22II14-10F7]
MESPNIRMILPALMLIASWVILFWKSFRQLIPVVDTKPTLEKLINYKRLKRVGGYYWIIFSIFILMTIIYSLLPDFSFIFLPLDYFDHPLINELGLMLLKVSIIWIIIAQLQIDRELYKYSREINSLAAMELVHYSEKMLLSGMLVLFLGFFTTVTNIAGLILVIVGLFIHFKTFGFPYSHHRRT